MRHFLKTYLPVGLLVSVFFFVSVAHGQENGNAAGPPPAVVGGAGKLEILIVDFTDFAALKKRKVIFAFTPDGSGKLILHGWCFHGLFVKDFKTPPDIKLKSYISGSVDLAPGIYFSNFILKNVKRIKKEFRAAGYKYVYFVPAIIDGQLHFKIIGSVSKTEKLEDLEKAHLVAPPVANPSPPKNR